MDQDDEGLQSTDEAETKPTQRQSSNQDVMVTVNTELDRRIQIQTLDEVERAQVDQYLAPLA